MTTIELVTKQNYIIYNFVLKDFIYLEMHLNQSFLHEFSISLFLFLYRNSFCSNILFF